MVVCQRGGKGEKGVDQMSRQVSGGKRGEKGRTNYGRKNREARRRIQE